MGVTDSNAAIAKASAEASVEAAANLGLGHRLLDRKELIDRMAKALRLKSGLDLPHGYFVEQVKLQLAGSPAFDRSLLGPEAEESREPASYRSADCFKAWAIPD